MYILIKQRNLNFSIFPSLETEARGFGKRFCPRSTAFEKKREDLAGDTHEKTTWLVSHRNRVSTGAARAGEIKERLQLNELI